MTVDPSKTEGRITEARYSELSDGHRTTLVVGMADMLECLAKYLDPKTFQAFEPILLYQRTLVGDDLRGKFDQYLADEMVGGGIAVASSFFSMLIEKSGARKN